MLVTTVVKVVLAGAAVGTANTGADKAPTEQQLAQTLQWCGSVPAGAGSRLAGADAEASVLRAAAVCSVLGSCGAWQGTTGTSC